MIARRDGKPVPYGVFPVLPDLGGVADGGLFAVADDGGFYKTRVLKELAEFILVIGEILQQGVVRRLLVHHSLKTHGAPHTRELAAAHAVAVDIYVLVLDPALLEVPLGLLGVKAL